MNEIKSFKGEKTIIIIAHRLSTLKFCDRIYRIENGKIAESGSYEDVIQRNENTTGLKYVANALKFDTKNLKQVMISIDPESDVDITLIIGKDFNTINTVKSYLNN